MLPTSRLCEAFTAFKLKCTLRRHDCFLATELPDSSRLPDCGTARLPGCPLTRLAIIVNCSVSFTHFPRIFTFSHFLVSPSFSAPARMFPSLFPLPLSLAYLRIVLSAVPFSFILSRPLEAALKMATASLQLIKRIHNTLQIPMEYIRYITLAWHCL